MTTGPSPPWRAGAIARLAESGDADPFDVLVVGAGATGAAIARDAALRGLRVALCDRGDFAGQTSSQSSRLIHGGLRYIQYGDLELVFEGLAERRRLMSVAPHLCRPVEFVFPAYRHSRPSLATLGLGIGIYKALALWRAPAGGSRIEPHQVFEMLPFLRSAGLRGAHTYVDCQTDDARLVLENVLDAQAAGAVVASYVEVERGPESGRWRRLRLADRLTGDEFHIAARAIINATGPFSDAWLGGPPALRPTLGVHLVVDAGRLPTNGRAVVIHSPRDGRLMFVLPAGHRTIVGTTDTDFRPRDQGTPPSPSDEIRARREDIAYLLDAANHAFPPARLVPGDVLATFAGLRPLLASSAASPSATSREHDIWIDDHGVLNVAGGKLTTMRRMAQEGVDQLVELLRARGVDRPIGRCVTRHAPLPGTATPLPTLEDHELAPDVRSHLLDSYGARAAMVLAIAVGRDDLCARLVPDLPYLRAEIVFAARHELAVEVDDVLRRRVPLFRQMDDQGLRVLDDVAAMLAHEFNWSAARRDFSVAAYRKVVDLSRRWQLD